MEETLGKRIVFHRKRLGLTQDALAERMGVTAQAVSKWENDQSCPDIGALPKLAEIFGISTDELLGVERKEVHPAEIVPADREENDVHPEMTWELSLDDGKKGGIGLAIWILLVGGIMLTSYLLNFHAKLWDVVWPSALLVFGIFGLFPRFSFFRLGCSLFGLYFLMSNLNFAPFRLGREFLLPVLLLLFGGSLLVDTLRKSKNGTHNSGCFSFHPTRNGGRKKEHCTCTGNFFDCDTAFGENRYTILLPTLGGGSADVSFGSLSVDLQKCEHLGENCTVDLNCAFGELVLIVPGRFRVEPTKSAAFASVSVSGAPDDNAAEVIHVNCDASFGEISIRYVYFYRFFHARTFPETMGSPRVCFIARNPAVSTCFSFFTFSSDFPCFFSLSMVEYY